MTIALLHEILDSAAERTPESPAVTVKGVTSSYRTLRTESLRIAQWLTCMGLRRGDRLVVAAPTHQVHVPLIYGCSRVGVVYVILHDQVTSHGLLHVLRDTEPVLLITDHPGAERIAEDHGVLVASPAQAAHGMADTQQHLPPAPFTTAPLTVDPVCLIYTSGSTGMPNAVVSTHAQVVFAAAAIQSQLSYRPSDVVYSPLPLSFDYGMYQLFVAALAGAHVHLADAADAGVLLLRRLRESRATVLPGVPSLAAILARLIERHGGTIPLRLLTNTGADLSARIVDQLRKQLPGLQVQLMFGLTECKRVSIMPPDHDRQRPGSCGKSLPGTEVVVVDDDGHPVPPRTVGEIIVRGPHVMAGYWRRPELTAKRFRRVGGLFPQLHTGDYGWLDEDGFLYFSGRRDDIYKSHGFRVSAIEVEAAAIRIPGVTAAAVLPPNAQRPEPVLFAVTDLTRTELHQLLVEQIEHYKVPRHCRVLDELPLNQNGKVDKAALAELGWRSVGTEQPRKLDVAVPKKLSA